MNRVYAEERSRMMYQAARAEPYPEPDYADKEAGLFVWWSEGGDPRIASFLEVAKRIPNSLSYRIEDWLFYEAGENDLTEPLWECIFISIDQSLCPKRLLDERLARGIGTKIIEKDIEEDRTSSAVFPVPIPAAWLEERFGPVAARLSLDPFTGEEALVVSGGTFWEGVKTWRSYKIVRARKGGA